MGIEVANYINQLVATNPLANDPKAEGDDHLRLLKTVLKQSFPNVGGAVNLTHTRMNLLEIPELAELTAGTAPNFTIAVPQVPPVAYAPRQIFFVTFHAAGTTGSNTLNIASLGDVDLKQRDKDGAKVDAVVTAGMQAVVMYDGTDFVILNALPKDPPAASETVAGLLEIATDAEAQAFTADKAIDGAKLDTAYKAGNQSLTAKGFQRLPGGLIIQWGNETLGSNVTTVYSLPTPFPNAALAGVMVRTDAGTSSTAMSGGALDFPSASQVRLHNGTAGTMNFYWIALGH